jgi:reversibly glycosylated polypeptide/UDP-arabinopyranose mutase
METDRKTMLVVPTCRPDSIKTFFEKWQGKGGWDTVCIIEDAPERTEAVANLCPFSFSHVEIADVLGDDAWIISKRDSACRNFGLLWAYWHDMDVLTLDDDCYPTNNYTDLVSAHRKAMEYTKWVDSVPGQRMRGKPYRNLSTLETVINVGLWVDNPDLDAIQTLARPHLVEGFIPPLDNRIIPHGQYVPTCGMNLYIKHEAIPLFYFALMGEGYPYRRFDDIWGGIIAKKALDTLGWHMSVGEPWIRHSRASNPFTNLVKEAPGIVANEEFWYVIDSLDMSGVVKKSIDVMYRIGSQLARNQEDYFQKLGGAIQTWAHWCRRGKP